MTVETTFYRDLACVFGAAVVGAQALACCASRDAHIVGDDDMDDATLAALVVTILVNTF